MRIRTIRYIGSSLALFAASTFFFSSFVTPHAKAVPDGGSKDVKTTGRSSEASGVSFTNPTPIIINTPGVASPYPSDISVTGLHGFITSVRVTLNGLSHQYAEDVGIVLQSPTGAALLIQDGAGYGINNITYTLADDGVERLPGQEPWPPGIYKPTAYYRDDSFPAPGPGTVYGNPGPIAGGTATFASTFNGTAPNGTWRLFVVDFLDPDGGFINGGWSLEITATGGGPFHNVVDFNSDGKTDWAVVRNTDPGGTNQMFWFIKENGGAEIITYQPFGTITTDLFVPEDYDGDSRTDIAVWRDPQGPGDAAYYILQSNTSTVRAELFGVTGDDPTIQGDYDGDGKADLAVTRRTGGQLLWFYRVAPNGPVFARQWGLATDFAAPGDYDGDGKFDFVVQRPTGITGQAAFWLNYAAAAPGVLSRYAVFGMPTDLITPGDYDGDGKTDLAVVRLNAGGPMNWFYEPSSAQGTFLGGTWGVANTDFIAQGDYDGDGKTDFAVYRTNSDPTQNFYLVRKSSDGALLSHEWGALNDTPVASYNVH